MQEQDKGKMKIIKYTDSRKLAEDMKKGKLSNKNIWLDEREKMTPSPDNLNLSEKIEEDADSCYPNQVIRVKDVKRFIEELKECFQYKTIFSKRQIHERINDLAGDKLNGNQ